MKNQKNRSMKVHSQSGCNYKATPTIILKDYSMPIALYSKNASAGIAYRKFAKELIAYEG